MSDVPSTHQFTVEGMTCDHCVAAVRQELEQLDGVSDVRVDLDSGAVELHSTRPLSGAELAAAVDAAGYQVAR